MPLPVLLLVLALAAQPSAPPAPTLLSGAELLKAIREAPEETPRARATAEPEFVPEGATVN